MGRKKSRPLRSNGPASKFISNDIVNCNIELEGDLNCVHNTERNLDYHRPYVIEVDSDHCASDQHLDIAEIVLKDIVISDGNFSQSTLEDGCIASHTSLRIGLSNIDNECFKLGHWPILSADAIFLELVIVDKVTRHDHVILSGKFDGPDEAVSGFAHLVHLKILSLRSVVECGEITSLMSFRVRVELQRSAFDTSDSLLEIPRQQWRKSMMNAMSWLRPEVTTSESKYRSSLSFINQLGKCDDATGSDPKTNPDFDIIQFYEAIKPSRDAPMLEGVFPDLLPELRPYQRRASYWMVQQEKRPLESPEKQSENELMAPFCVPVNFLDGHSRMFYNPFCGSFSLHPEFVNSHVSGGILADEMGLGKTVELLACIFANRAPLLGDAVMSDKGSLVDQKQVKRIKRERVECICGAVAESYNYKGLWVQCDTCDAWQHADCVGYLPQKKIRSCGTAGNLSPERKFSRKSNRRKKTRYYSDVVEMDGDYRCPLCLELAEATGCTISSGATLIVCPAPILMQWYSEITRHTRPGSLKASIYEGAKNLTPTTLKTNMNELATADIVLTTYDVLKEDLSHDSDRHDGDRRLMRFQKRYPVTPTPLTRIDWWRLCLDEAQMVESNTAAVTEMALRLHARHRWCVTGTPIQRRFDDIFGLLRFLGARPFDVYKWWSEVLRDPYERRDAMAMDFTHNFFKKIMWRSSKAHVSDELGLPPQEDRVSWLSFSAVEEHFYRKQHETCIACAQELIVRFKEEFIQMNQSHGSDASCDAFLSHREASKLLSPLLKIRQACCHPQVGSSGLRSLHQSPMTMDEILDVLISKTKIEGEEALRRIVIALNGLAAIAVIENEHDQAVSLYKEALALAKANSDDFRLDPLLNLHIHHNLADLLPFTSEPLSVSAVLEYQLESTWEKTNESCNGISFALNGTKQGTGKDSSANVIGCFQEQREIPDAPSCIEVEADMVTEMNMEQGSQCQSPLSSFKSSIDCHLRTTCESIKQKYLSVFISKLSVAQQDLWNSQSQVSTLFKEIKSEGESWWLQSLLTIEQSKELTEGFIKKIDLAISSAAGMSGSSRVPLRYRSIGGLKYSIQTDLDSVEKSRHSLLERLLEIDETMKKPKEDDIERVRTCPNCLAGDGPLCIHCDLDSFFQVYEARLFRLKKGNLMAASAEEAVALQNKKKELNLFFRDSRTSDAAATTVSHKGQRHVSTNVVVSRSPSDLEVILGVIRSYSKSQMGREGSLAATKQLLLFEAMRKEFANARSLSLAQAQLLRAHDEIKMSTSRLRLRISEHEPTASNVLSEGELVTSTVQFSNDKLLSLSLLARIKGQLRYLKGLVFSKQNKSEPSDQTIIEDKNIPITSACMMQCSTSDSSFDVQPCPICHDKLGDQKMMFQCGHVTCCKCFLELTEPALARSGKCEQKWVMCPTCRQHTDIGNVAYVDDKKCAGQGMVLNPAKSQNMSESSIVVQGSYGTKIEAITRRILLIRSTDQEAKFIVFSSWKDVLDVLEHAFHANKISFVRMKGGRKSQVAIAQFKGQTSSNSGERGKGTQNKDKFVQVLLLLMRHGANGLNILEAQHVILVEPLLNPAMEAQAINRVHRIGQEKETFVHRFMIKNTVEKSIYKLNRSRAVNTIISNKSRHQDQPSLTLRDIESLISPIAPSEAPETEEQVQVGSLMHLPPSVAAGLAAERRLMQSSGHHTT